MFDFTRDKIGVFFSLVYSLVLGCVALSRLADCFFCRHIFLHIIVIPTPIAIPAIKLTFALIREDKNIIHYFPALSSIFKNNCFSFLMITARRGIESLICDLKRHKYTPCRNTESPIIVRSRIKPHIFSSFSVEHVHELCVSSFNYLQC